MTFPDTRALSPDEYEDLLAQQDWKSLAKRLTEFAYRGINQVSFEDAEDIAQTAIRKAFDARYQRWNPKTQPNLFWFLGSLVNGEISNRRKKNRRDVVVLQEQEDIEELQPEAVHATDEVLARRERAKLIVLELERRVAQNRPCRLVLAAFASEIDDPRAQAESGGLTMQEVYNARTKLRLLALEITETFDRGTLK